MPTQLPQNFDPDSQEGNSWDLLPADKYLAQIVEASVLQPRNGDGYYVALTWRIIDGPYEGRQVWQRITYLHSSEQAQTIGRKALKDLCIALGVTEHVEDVEIFMFKEARIRVGLEKDKTGEYDDKNKVKCVLPPEQASVAKPQGSTPRGAATKPAATKQSASKPGRAGSAPWHQG